MLPITIAGRAEVRGAGDLAAGQALPIVEAVKAAIRLDDERSIARDPAFGIAARDHRLDLRLHRTVKSAPRDPGLSRAARHPRTVVGAR